LYVTLFISLGFWLRVSGSARDTILVGAVIVCVLAAAFFDIRENRSTLSALASYEMNTLNHSLLIRKYQAYVAKWALIAFVLALLATLSLLRARPFGGVALLLAAVSLGIGLAGRHSLVEWGYSLMGIGLLLSAFSI
jgi:hypothetical protein